MDSELQQIVNGLQSLSDKLASEGRLVEATVAWGGIVGIRALRSKLEPPKATTAEEAVVDEANESPEKKNATP